MAQFDWVIIDTPPVGLMPDANLLAAMVDAAFVVVHAGRTPYPLVKKAVDAIGLERVLGVVLNRAERSAAAAAYNYGYYDYYADPARHVVRSEAARTRLMLRPTWRSAMLLAGESALIFGAIVAASYVRLGADAWVLLGNAGGLLRAALVLAVCQTTLHYADLYDVRFVTDVRELMVQAAAGGRLHLDSARRRSISGFRTR